MEYHFKKSVLLRLSFRIEKYFWLALPIILVILIWEGACFWGLVNNTLFPPPWKVAVSLWTMLSDGSLISDILASLWRVIFGLIIGSAIGIILGIATGRSKKIAKIISPLIHILRPLPPVAIIPLIIVWLGIGDVAKIFSISFAVFFPVWISAHIGSERIPSTYLWSARFLTASKLKVFFKLILPSSLPFIMSGIRTGVAMAFIMVFVSELAGASQGLGYRISISEWVYRIDDVMASLIVLALLCAVVDQLFIYLSNKVWPWIKLNR
ncbi:MAG: ABC transporter permease [Patescibacteria group bacterium]